MKFTWRDKLSHKILILVFLPLVFELIFITCLDQWLKQVEALQSEKSKEIITATETVGKLVYDGGMALMCFMQTDNAMWAGRYATACDQMRATVKKLKELVKDNQEEMESAKIIETNQNTHLARLAQIKQALDMR